MLFAVVGFAALLSEPEVTAPLRADARYARIIIVGNTDTPDRVIHQLVEIRPGQRITFGQIARARKALKTCGIFQTNPWLDDGPTIELLPNEFDSQFLDVRIRVVERPGNWVVFGLAGMLEHAIFAVLLLDTDRFFGELVWFGRRAAQELLP